MLADRLAKRGIAPAIVAAVAAGTSVVEACEVPRALAASAARIGSDAVGTVPAHVAALADGAIRAMSLRAIVPYLAGVLVAVFAAIGVGAWATPPAPPPSLPTLPLALAAAAEPAAEAADSGRLLIMREPAKMSLITPDGKTGTPTLQTELPAIVAARVAGRHDRRVQRADAPAARTSSRPGTPRYLPLAGQGEPIELDAKGQYACWSADGKKLAVVQAEQIKRACCGRTGSRHRSEGEKKLDAEATDAIRDWSPDGKFFLAVRRAPADGKLVASAILLDEKGKFLRALTTSADDFLDARLSPDGEWALVVTRKTRQAGETGPVRSILLVVPTSEGKIIRVTDLPENGSVTTACWSPDGKRIAFTWQQVFESPPTRWSQSFLIISDRDGGTSRPSRR